MDVPPINPDTAAPIWKSTSMIFSTDEGSSRVDVKRFSTARMMPALVWIPTAVEPSFTASIAYSTWKSLTLDTIYNWKMMVTRKKSESKCGGNERTTIDTSPALRREGIDSTIVFASSQIHFHNMSLDLSQDWEKENALWRLYFLRSLVSGFVCSLLCY